MEALKREYQVVQSKRVALGKTGAPCWLSCTVIALCSHLLLSPFCLSCFPHRDAKESVPMAAEPGLPAGNACAPRTDGTCVIISVTINRVLL